MKRGAFISWLLVVLAGGAHGLPLRYLLPDSAEDTHPLGVGQVVPDVTIKSADGAGMSLRKQMRAKPTVLIFYRGGWCPYCSAHLGELQKVEGELIALGYQILAISADEPKALRPTSEKMKLRYTLLSDEDMEASAAFGLAFRVSAETLAKYKEFGIELTAKHDGRYWLPVPAVYIADRDGKIVFAHADPNYRKRLPAADLLTAAREAAAP